jgi:hypothetical protein
MRALECLAYHLLKRGGGQASATKGIFILCLPNQLYIAYLKAVINY